MGKKLIVKGANFSGGAIVPEYTQVSCIKASSNKSVVLSPVPFTATSKVEVVYTIPIEENGKYFGYVSNASQAPSDSFYISSSSAHNKLLFYFNQGSNYTSMLNLDTATQPLTMSISRSSVKVNGSAVSINTPASTPNNVTIGMLGANGYSAANVTGCNGLKLHSFKQYSDLDGNNLVVDAIPVVKEGKAYMYDKISDTYLSSEDSIDLLYEA